MKSAEDFVNQLFEQQHIPRELCAELKLRISQVGQQIPADTFAQRLVERGVITQSVAETVLKQFAEGEKEGDLEKKEHLRQQEKAKINTSLKKMKTRFGSGSEKEERENSSPNSRSNIQSVANANYQADSTAIPHPPFSSRSQEWLDVEKYPYVETVKPASTPAPWKKKKAKSWESTLFLIGGGALFVLVFIAIILYSSIYQHSAEFVLNAANTVYDSGNYIEAVRKYTDFINSYPNHSALGTSKIRLSISKMRLTTEGKNDWLQSLDVAKKELENITQQSNYREEAQPELNAILPSIAEHLSEMAKTKPETALINATEEALLLIQKYVPVSEQPQTRLEKIRANLDFAHRTISKEDRLKTDSVAIEQALEAGEIATAYEIVGRLLRDYPQLVNDPELSELVKTISKREQTALRWVAQPISENVNLGKSAESKTTSETASETQGRNDSGLIKHQRSIPAILLANRIVSVDTPATRSERVLFVLTGGSLFGIRSTDGAVLWKKDIGIAPLSQGTVPEVHSFRYSGSEEDGLIVDYQNWELVRFNAKTGDDVFRIQIGEPFRLMSVTQNAPIVLTTETGKLCEIDPNNGSSRGYLQLPQKITVAPIWDTDHQRILQLAPQSTLYIGESGKLDQPESSHSFFLGHSAGSVRIPPFLFGPYLVVAEQTGPDQTVLRFFQYQVETSENPNDPEKDDESNRPRSFLQQVQEIPIPGTLKTAPVVDRSHFFLATDTGQVFLFDCDSKNPDTSPVRLVARSTVREGTGIHGKDGNEMNEANKSPGWPERGTRLFLGLYDQTLWCAGDQLVSFDVQQSRERFVPKFTIDPVTKTLAPLRRIEDVVFRVFQHRNQQNVAIKAISLHEGKTLWETQLTDPTVTEPIFVPEQKALRLITQSGKMYLIPLDLLSQPDSQSSSNPTGSTSSPSLISSTPAILDKISLDLGGEKRGQPIWEIVPLARNFEAWIEFGHFSKSIPVYDPDPSNARSFRFIPLDSELQASPIAFGPGLLVPLKNGQVQLVDPKIGSPITVDPFVGKIVPNQMARWSSPLARPETQGTESPEFFIIDQNSSTVYQIVLVQKSGAFRFQTISYLGDLPENCDKLAILGNDLFAFSKNSGEIVEITLPKLIFKNLLKLQSPIGWGPYTVHDGNRSIILFATRNNQFHQLSSTQGADSTSSVELQSVPLPQSIQLVGKPLAQSGKIYLLLADGTLLTYDPARNNWSETVATGVIPQTGPIVIDNRILLTGKDGCLYWGPVVK